VSALTRFVTVARLVPQKGIDVLVEACYLLHRRGVSFEVRVVGDGPDRGALERRVAELGLADRVRFVGQTSAVAPHLADADAFVLPSRYEGLPFTILEAMCAGLPVVSTRVSGIPEAVGDGAGLLVPPEDAEALAGAMEELCRDPARRAAMANVGAERVRRVFAWEQHLTAVERLYEPYDD
jgi:glycosyltransferase involved in cell wall biosynthesis